MIQIWKFSPLNTESLEEMMIKEMLIRLGKKSKRKKAYLNFRRILMMSMDRPWWAPQPHREGFWGRSEMLPPTVGLSTPLRPSGARFI